MTDASAGASANAFVERGAAAETTMKERGYLTYEVVGPDGKVKQTATSENALTTEGAAYILGLVKPSSPGTQDTSLFLGLIGDDPTLAVTDTMASHVGWTEETATGYVRIAWLADAVTPGAPAALAKQSSWPPVVGRAQLTVWGAFLVTELGAGTPVTLIATSALTGGGSLSVGAEDTLNITFKLTLA